MHAAAAARNHDRDARLEWYARKKMVGTLSGRHTLLSSSLSTGNTPPVTTPKNLDWRVMGKSDRSVIKQYIEETNLRAIMAVDVSGSMEYTGDYAAKLNDKPLYTRSTSPQRSPIFS